MCERVCVCVRERERECVLCVCVCVHLEGLRGYCQRCLKDDSGVCVCVCALQTNVARKMIRIYIYMHVRVCVRA